MATTTKKPLTSKQRTTRILVTALIVTIALLIGSIGGAIAYSNYLNNGGASRRLISFKTDHYKVNNCMLTYFYFTDAYNYYQNYGPYMAYMAPSQQAPDMTSSLSAQYYDYGTESGTAQTWHEYLLNMTLSNVQGYLFYAEEAIANNFKCEDLDTLVNDYIDGLKKDAQSKGISFEEHIEKFYGKSVKEKDIRDALELQYYASEYLSFVQEDMESKVTDAEYENYIEENKDSVYMIDYYSFSFETEIPEDMTDEDKTAADEANKTSAAALEEELKNAEDKPAAFKEWITKYLTDKNALEEEPMSEEDLAADIEEKTKETTNTTKDDSEFSIWAFDEERASGDILNLNEATAKHTVYLITAPSHIDEDATKNVRHILITPDTYGDKAEEKAQEVLDKFLAGDDQSEDAFDAIAKEYNEDGSSFYENVTAGTMVETFDAWIYDEARQVGDTGIVETEYGYHVMYFSGDGMPTWKATALESIVQTKMETNGTELQAKYEDSLEVDQNALLKVPDALPAAAFTEAEETLAGGTEPTTTETDPEETTADTSDETTDTTGDTSADTTDDTTETEAETAA